jgi:Fic family protein
MHIEKRRAGKKIKYYLAHAFRTDGKARKVRVYLGNNKAVIVEKRIHAEQIIKEKMRAYEVISDPFKHALDEKELKEIRSLEAKGTIKISHLNEDDWQKFTKSFVYDTNAIEGSSITYSEVMDILEDEKWPKEKEKWEISETYGLRDAVNHIRTVKEHLSVSLIKDLHKITFRNSKPFAGKFRKKGQEVVVMNGLGQIVHRGAPSVMVTSMLHELINWYDKNKKKYSPIILAAVVHNQFENIHPFADGNGRIGRLLLNNVLIKHNKPPVNIELKNRKEYYAALREYQNNGNIRPTIKLILKEYRNLKKLLKTVNKR